MRIRLEKGIQKKLIIEAKNETSWKDFSKKLDISPNYLRNDLIKERRILSEQIYLKLCEIAKVNFDNQIINRLPDNWGKSKGGSNSRGSTKKLTVSENNLALAELIGIILGDGNINYYKKGKKVGVYQIKIAGDFEKDKIYHLGHVKNLFESLFNIKVKELVYPKHGERFLYLSSKELVEYFIKNGLKAGDKIKNQVTIPEWIYKNSTYLRVCIRGLIDTDGSIFKMSNRDPQLLRISFTNYNLTLLNDTRNAFIKLGFHPSNITGKNSIYLSRKADIEKYIKEIKFANSKHLNRLQLLSTRPNSPVV